MEAGVEEEPSRKKKNYIWKKKAWHLNTRLVKKTESILAKDLIVTGDELNMAPKVPESLSSVENESAKEFLSFE